MRVAACNTSELPPNGRNPQSSYDFQAFGQFKGDARTSTPFIDALIELEGNGKKFDLFYIRNPYLRDLRDWIRIIVRALEWTDPSGAVVILARDKDHGSHKNLVDLLRTEFKVSPSFFGETGVKMDEQWSLSGFNPYHTISIFKPKEDKPLD